MRLLVIYDRQRRRKPVYREFTDGQRHEALRARFSAEAQHLDDPDIEVVVLAAESVAVMRRTHSRYFPS